MNYDLDKLHFVLVEILDYFVSICEKNNLRYFLVYGTALGAYRHKGFIPWDDDLDVAMPRKDYQKFLEIMQHTNDDYILQNEGNENNWFLSFSKVRKKNTIFVESIAEDVYQYNGIYIDVFPLDNIDNIKSIQNIINTKGICYIRHSLKFDACKKLYKEKYSRLRYCIESVITAPIHFASRKRVLSILNKKRTGKCTEENAKWIAEYDEPRALSIPYEVYFPPRKIIFEGKFYSVPNKIDEYLKIVYGDTYMEMPPVGERKTHQPIELKY